MKILTAEEMQAADAATFERLLVPSRVVMENAGREVVRFILERYPDRLRRGVLVFAGGGNNGGDGYVVARTLLTMGYLVEVSALKPVSELSGDAAANAASFLAAGGHLRDLNEETWQGPESLHHIKGCGIIVDAMLGTGFRGPLRGMLLEAIDGINFEAATSGIPIVAIDIPSGVSADGSSTGIAISATTTIALQCLKLAHVLFPTTSFCGEICVADIGISTFQPEVEGVKRDLVTQELVQQLLAEGLQTSPEDHKGTRGHVLVIGGGAGHYGAPKLSAEAALRSGAGLVTVLLPGDSQSKLSIHMKELMSASLPGDTGANFSGEGLGELETLLSPKQSVVIGPGMGLGEGSASLLRKVLEYTKAKRMPTVLDADALNIISSKQDLLGLLGPHCVLTPHPGEMGRLCNAAAAEVQEDRVQTAYGFATTHGCWLVLKGARTIICSPDGHTFINPAATPVLATAGAGDVLAGMIAALLSRGMPVGEGAIAAVFVHGASGELLAEERGGNIGTVAGEIVETVPYVINRLIEMEPSLPTFLQAILPGSLRNFSEGP